MVKVGGSDTAFRCICDANVFYKTDDPEYGEVYICNACGREYQVQ